MRLRAIAAAILAGLVVSGQANAQSAATQPAQPRSGPGGSEYAHRDWRLHAGGSGNDAFYVFEPVKPRPRRAPVAVLMHGYYELAGYDQLYELIRHTVRKGSVVIYPRWQRDVASPCPGPFDVEPCIRSAVSAIRGGLAYLHESSRRVQPRVNETSYFGFSFGGILTADLTNRYRSLHLPKPRAIFLEDPHDGGLTAPASRRSTTRCGASLRASDCSATPARRASSRATTRAPAATRSSPSSGTSRAATRTSCSAGPTRTATRTSSLRTACARHRAAGPTRTTGTSAGRSGTPCAAAPYVAGAAATRSGTREHRSNGRWSDGVPIAPLTIQDAAPIRP